METKLPQKKKGEKKKKKNNYYFTLDTEDAILEFQREQVLSKKQQIFIDRIRPAFLKLIENIIFVYKFHSIGNLEALKQDCISFLYESLNKFDGSRGHRAFAYFNIVTKNWFIQRVKNYKKRSNSDVHFDNSLLAELEKNNHHSVVVSYEDDVVKREFFATFQDELESWRGKFDKEQELKVLEAIILLFTDPDSVPLFNKKSVFTYLREISGLNTKQLVTNLNKFKKRYFLFKKKYYNGDY